METHFYQNDLYITKMSDHTDKAKSDFEWCPTFQFVPA